MLLTSILSTTTIYSAAQNRVYTYYFNAKMESAPKEKAVIVGKGRTVDSFYLVQYYKMADNRLLWFEQFKDSTLEVLHGDRVLFHPNRKVEEKSHFENNRLTGLLMKWDSTGNLTDSGHYKEDHLLFEVKKRYVNHRWLYNAIETDSINNTLRDTDYDSTGNKLREIAFVGSSGTWTEYQKDGTVESVDSVFTREDREAKFPPQNGGWRTYLERNLDGMVPIRNGATGGQGTVIIQFVVEKDGTLSNMKALTKIGYGAEEEVLRILKKSPKWIPASRYGKIVKAYRKQPVTFQIRG
ncbi:energy transducer TonB [Niabella hibiscisoli]|uniref:energy transducer TonB n=1 Tax=Niabella hibiscisoli TaxID=1825928 RepID=UPI001F10DD6C|nr:energy transducer TonB [Niabella hibiscisoli]MCH5715654.1 energy transducer TonB [Niabella hibiscisoli]